MKANKVIERLDAIRPNSYSEEQKLEWINNLEEMVQMQVMEIPVIRSLSYPEDMDTELFITAPFDNLYGLYLESMIDYYNREYGNYNNSALMFETRFDEYKKAYIRGDLNRKASDFFVGISDFKKLETVGNADTYEMTLTDGNSFRFTVTNGKDGKDGATGSTGKDGVSVTHSWNGTVLSITSASGESSADLRGERGNTGDTGVGIASIAKTSTEGLVDTYTITLTDRRAYTFQVTNGEDGSIEQFLEELESAKNDALTEIERAKNESVSTIEQTKNSSLTKIIEATVAAETAATEAEASKLSAAGFATAARKHATEAETAAAEAKATEANIDKSIEKLFFDQIAPPFNEIENSVFLVPPTYDML